MRILTTTILLIVFYCSNAQPQLVGPLSSNGSLNGGGLFRLNMPGTSPGIIHQFNNLSPHYPSGGLCAANDDWLYGILNYNGTNSNGGLYKIRRDGTGFTMVHNLDHSGGTNTIPYLHDDGYIYFSNDFELKKTDTATNTTITLPLNAGILARNLVIDTDDWVYFSTTINTVAKVKTDGSMWTELHSFNPVTEGESGLPGLTETPGDTLFGLMSNGGINNGGTLFSIKKDGSGFTIHHHFNNPTGIYPESRLVLFDGKLFGTTTQGGAHGFGVLYCINVDGTGYRIIRHFEGGAIPVGSVRGNIHITSNGRIFGSFYQFFFEPSFIAYRLFKIDTSGDAFQPIIPTTSSDQRTFGHFNRDILMAEDEETLFLTTSTMGRHDGGVVSRFDTSGSGMDLYHFGYAPNGFYPTAGLVKGSDNKLYGTASIGGITGNGIIFSINPDGTGFTKLHEFSDAEGFELSGKLLEASDGKLYGATRNSSSGSGNLYRLDKNGNNFELIYNFPDLSLGYNPRGSLVENNGQLYGTTIYSFPGGGVVFRINRDGTGYTVIRNFDNVTGLRNPVDGVVITGDFIYGHAEYGGTENNGGLYRVNKNGTGYQELHEFNGAQDGANPWGIPVIAGNGKIYGATSNGGTNGFGMVYSIETTGINYSVLRNFSDATDGSYPRVLIQASDGALYGTTLFSPMPGSGGMIYRMNLDGSAFSVIHEFNSSTQGWGPLGLMDLVPGTPLPVNWISFTGRKINADIVLNWETANEFNNKHFEIERSTELRGFTRIGQVNATGHTNASASYQFTDPAPLKGNNFYRLKQVDLDGRYSYSKIIRITMNDDNSIFLYPNPAREKLQMLLPTSNDFTSLGLYDANGNLLFIKTINKGSVHEEINIQNLAKGWYIIELKGKENIRRGFIKE